MTIRDDVEVALRNWTSQLHTKHNAAFIVGGHQRHGGQPWKQLESSTIRQKGHPRILWETGNLARSVFTQVAGLSMIIGVDSVPYAFFHQFGYRHHISGKKVPARPPISITSKDMNDLVTEIKKTVGVDVKVTRVS